MYVRLKFKKEGPIKFIGHLDLMRTFQKLFRRAELPMAYSEGFNPHPIFSFATALAVGVSSEGEYLDLRLAKPMLIETLVEKLNEHAPQGIVFIKGAIMDDKTPKAMGIIAAAKYQITCHETMFNQESIHSLLEAKEVLIEKTSKKGKNIEFDIRPGIYNLQILGNVLTMTIATGSDYNIRPEMLLEVLCNKANMTYDRGNYYFHRLELFERVEDNLQPLLP